MVVVGADVHKRTHTFVAVDEVGKKLGQLTVKADGTGHDKAVRWAQTEFGADLVWDRGLPTSFGAAGDGPARGGSGGGAGTAEADGPAASDRPHPREVGPD